jgi:beta-phosphoglucomutase-like phosphatase (HAD superfamily)
MTDSQDGTLTDSIAAVEAAWTAKANELGMDPDKVIAATHGRRASDNLQELIPSLKPHHVNQEVDSEFQSFSGIIIQHPVIVVFVSSLTARIRAIHSGFRRYPTPISFRICRVKSKKLVRLP